jgi:hypothetical protein
MITTHYIHTDFTHIYKDIYAKSLVSNDSPSKNLQKNAVFRASPRENWREFGGLVNLVTEKSVPC